MKIKLICAMLIAALAAGAASGCAPNSEAQPGNAQAVEAGEDDKKTLTIAFPDTLTTVDIADIGAATMLKEVAGVVETLVYASADFTMEPMLATQWERTGDFTWEFQLRDDVTFHDGSKFNAEAVKWCIERSLDKNSALAGATYIQSVEVLDEYRVQFTTFEKTSDLPAALSYVGAGITAPSSVDENGEFTRAVGTGYFMQESFDEASGIFECVAYDGYRDDIDTSVTRRVVRSMTDAGARSLAAQNGEVDIASDVPFSDLEMLSGSDTVNVSKFNTARTYFYAFNMNKARFQDERVRKALIHAINKEEIVNDVLLGVGGVPNGIIMDEAPWANTDVDTYDYDVEKALSLLAEAGYSDTDGDGYLDKDGERLSIKILSFPKRPGCPLIVQATQGYFAAIGVDTSVEILDWSAMNELIKAGDYDMALNSAATAYIPTPAYYFETYYCVNDTGYVNEELNALIDKCKEAEAIEEKYEYSRQAQAVAQQDAALFTPALYGAVFAVSKDVTGFEFNAAAHDFIVPYETDIK